MVITDPFLVTVRIKIFWKNLFFSMEHHFCRINFFCQIYKRIRMNLGWMLWICLSILLLLKYFRKKTTWEFKKIKFKMYLIWCFKNQILICGGSRSTSLLYTTDFWKTCRELVFFKLDNTSINHINWESYLLHYFRHDNFSPNNSK